MWRSLFPCLALCVVAACAATDPNKSSGNDNIAVTQAHIVRTAEVPLGPATTMTIGQPAHRVFQAVWSSGRVDSEGVWQNRSEIPHNRLRCGVYEVGMQLGQGNPGCVNVRWVTDVEFATRQRQCNSATRIHKGGGRFSNMADRLEEASCVRVVVRCEGTC
jgi:hypothetical protein